MDLKKQKERDFRKYAMKWAPVAFVGTFAPLCLCIFTIIVGTLVVETASTDCVQPLDGNGCAGFPCIVFTLRLVQTISERRLLSVIFSCFSTP